MKKILALLATSRIANVPSVVSNVFTGMMLCFSLFNGHEPWSDDATMPTILTACCLYVAGNFLNDWHDAEWDRMHRPERAIPSALFPRWFYLLVSLVLFSAAGAIALSLSKTVFLVALGITVLVIAYTLLHKKTMTSIWLMGACRAGLYLLGWAAMDAGFRNLHFLFYGEKWSSLLLSFVIFPGLSMTGLCCYIAGISLLARFESRPDAPANVKMMATILLLSPCLTHTCLWVSFAVSNGEIPWFLFAALPFFLWTMLAIRKKMALPRKVSHLLAGIALVDSVFLCGYAAVTYSPSSNPAVYLIPILAWAAALLLQKLAPAT
jgi:4-hydroxybenzoate polyprenyltransferase